jgi:hypothetical protein
LERSFGCERVLVYQSTESARLEALSTTEIDIQSPGKMIWAICQTAALLKGFYSKQM